MEWPADEPKADRSLDILIWAILLLSLASSILLRDSLHLLLALTLLLGACGLALLDALLRREDAGRAIARAVRAVSRDEHPQYAIDSLVALELRGRAGLRLRVALRCLDEARRNRRLEWRLRQEAVKWLLETKDELNKEVRT